MNGSFLLDTNIVIASFSGESSLVERIDDVDAYFVSSTILGELFYGALNSANPTDNIARIESLLRGSGVLSCDTATSEIYGEVKTGLRRRGRPIPDNDIWIAATARQHSLTLVTRARATAASRWPGQTRRRISREDQPCG